MKRLFTIILFVSLKSFGQIYTQSNTDGSITITSKGLQGKFTPLMDTTNVALGPSALRSLTNPYLLKYNTAIGTGAMAANTIGAYNSANGNSALMTNTIGSYNTANGYAALRSNNKGHDNTAIGQAALYSNKDGVNNTAIGSTALYSNTDGVNNTATGMAALYYNSTGEHNTADGQSALFNNTTGNNNVAIGYNALWNNTMGGQNVAIGKEAGVGNITGSNNTFLGYGAGPFGGANNSSVINSTAIGSLAVVDASNKIRFGNGGVTVVEGPVAYSFPSDRRLKENILYTSHLGLDFINRLQTVSYNYISDKTHVRHDGFIAQDIETVMKELNVPFSGLKKSEEGIYSLAYSDFVMPLVNAVKELKQQNEDLRKEVTELRELKQQVEALTKMVTKQ